MVKFIEVEKEGHTLQVTEKAYRVVYAPKGYKKVDAETEETFDDLTVADLKAKLDEQGVEYDPKAKKDELIALLEEE